MFKALKFNYVRFKMVTEEEISLGILMDDGNACDFLESVTFSIMILLPRNIYLPSRERKDKRGTHKKRNNLTKFHSRLLK